MVKKYLVTGANGYIASHIIDQLLKQGNFIRGTVRNINDNNKVEWVKKLGDIELVQAEFEDPESWKRAARGIDVIFHVATALPASILDTGKEDELIKPTVEGNKEIKTILAF